MSLFQQSFADVDCMIRLSGPLRNVVAIWVCAFRSFAFQLSFPAASVAAFGRGSVPSVTARRSLSWSTIFMQKCQWVKPSASSNVGDFVAQGATGRACVIAAHRCKVVQRLRCFWAKRVIRWACQSSGLRSHNLKEARARTRSSAPGIKAIL